jgi:hypothetical protein
LNTREILSFHLFNCRSADSLPGLMTLEDEAFVHAASRILLDRPLAPEEFESYVFQLRCGDSKLTLLALLAWQPSARSNLDRLPGLRWALRGYRLGRLPVLGFLFRRLWRLPGETSAERRLRVIENELYLLARHLVARERVADLPLAPWGGISRAEWLNRTRERIDGLTPEALAVHEKLIAAAKEAAATSAPNAAAD